MTILIDNCKTGFQNYRKICVNFEGIEFLTTGHLNRVFGIVLFYHLFFNLIPKICWWYFFHLKKELLAVYHGLLATLKCVYEVYIFIDWDKVYFRSMQTTKRLDEYNCLLFKEFVFFKYFKKSNNYKKKVNIILHILKLFSSDSYRKRFANCINRLN